MKPYVAILAACLCFVAASSLTAQLVISANENKIDLDPGAATVIQDAAPDTLTLLDFKSFPPEITHLEDVSNTVIGPPSNVAITPDGKLALIADSLKIDPSNPTNTIPNNRIHILDLSGDRPAIVGSVQAGLQPSGMSITADGKTALVANRAGGTVTVLAIEGKEVKAVGEVNVCEPGDSASDVAISPSGKTALVSIQNNSVLVELILEGTSATVTGRQFSVFGKPYRVVITPDGQYGITAGAGFGGPLDRDAVSVVDLASNPPRTIQHLTTGSSPESLEISPNGNLLAVVTMDASNLAPGDPHRSGAGGLYIYRRSNQGFELSQELATGRIPEGVAFTGDGRYLVVQCHPDRELRVYRVRGNRVRDTGDRIAVPGMPSALRAAGY